MDWRWEKFNLEIEEWDYPKGYQGMWEEADSGTKVIQGNLVLKSIYLFMF